MRCHLLLATALVFALAGPAAVLGAENGFNPDTGQINPGQPQPMPSASPDTPIPSPEESRAAIMEPVSTQPSAGDDQVSAPSATIGSGGQGATASGAGSAVNVGNAEPPPSGPIGAIGQTVPAKFSKRNAILDRTPTMAMPMKLSDDARRKIYDAVMAEKTPPAPGAEKLVPASQLTPDQALNGMHPLPQSLADIAQLQHLHYVKAKDKVLLVTPATRTVVEQIKS